jgi:outer membrane protein OmpA-like peptidoglycan-associated protein
MKRIAILFFMISFISFSQNKELEINLDWHKPIYFSKNSIQLNDDELVWVNRYLNDLKTNPKINIEIRGHCDSLEKNSKKLSLKRSKAIRNYFISKGINKKRIKVKSFGSNQLVNRCDKNVDCSEEERQQNRRCEMIITAI